MQAELQSIATQAQDRASYLRLAETLSAFLSRLRSAAETLDVTERRRIVRLLVKEVLVGEDAIIIRHSIPVTSPPRNDGSPKSSKSAISEGKSYLLRSGRRGTSLRSSLMPLDYHPVCEYTRVEVAANQPEHAAVRDPPGQPSHQQGPRHNDGLPAHRRKRDARHRAPVGLAESRSWHQRCYLAVGHFGSASATWRCRSPGAMPRLSSSAADRLARSSYCAAAE